MKKLLLLLLSIGFISPIYADLDIGTTAYDNGDYQTALKEFKILAEQGHAKAQHNVGWMYKSDVEGIPKDDKQALYWFIKAAEQGVAESQLNVAIMYDDGEGTPQDYEQALYWYTKAAEQGVAFAQHTVAYMYANAQGTAQDYEKAIYWYTEVANQGDAETQNYLGGIYFSGEFAPIDYEKAVYWWTKAAEQGYVESQNNLGWMYANGDGVPRDYKKALYWYKKLAEQGDSAAQYNLGLIYLEGVSEVVPQSYKDAAYWIKLSLDNGDEDAQILWDAYELWKYVDTGVDLDKAIEYAEAGEAEKAEIELYTISQLAMGGNPKAMCEFGTMYMKEGYWIVQSDESAVEWWLKSANQGYAPCQFNVGSAYLIGKGIEKDLSQAKYWLQKAIDSDDEEFSESARVLYGIHELEGY